MCITISFKVAAVQCEKTGSWGVESVTREFGILDL
jgi:hypothetical protein